MTEYRQWLLKRDVAMAEDRLRGMSMAKLARKYGTSSALPSKATWRIFDRAGITDDMPLDEKLARVRALLETKPVERHNDESEST